MYAIYSAKQTECCPILVYEKPDGSEVLVTAVEDKPGCPSIMWDDKQDRGEVARFLRVYSKPAAK